MIFTLSTETYENSFTAWLLSQLLRFLNIQVTPGTFAVLHHVVRKLAHLTEYAMFSFLLYGCFSAGNNLAWRTRTALWCVALAGTYALTDEFHQFFIRGRSASLVDCGIDTAGAALSMLALFARERRVQAKASRSTAKRESPQEV